MDANEQYVPLWGAPAEEKVRIIHIRDSTASVNWIATSPIWTFFAVVLLSLLGPIGTAALVAAVISLPILAFLDRAALVKTGLLAPPSPLWIVLTPFVYLTLRWLAVRPYTGGGRMPLAVFSVCVAIISGFCLIAAGLAGLTAVTEHLPAP